MNIEYPQKQPVRFFNTTGPCYPWDHYMLPPADRLIDAQLDRYIKNKLYWVRQVVFEMICSIATGINVPFPLE